MIFILGGGGFVGSAFVRLFEKLGQEFRIITRKNYREYNGAHCDFFINANGNSKKYLSAKDPLWDFDASVRSVVEVFENFDIDKYIHLSTGDVYPKQDSPEVSREDLNLDPSGMSRYGLHKFLAEQLVRGVRPEALIVRMGGFVGPNMSKNAIFDMLNDAPVWLAPTSELQFISTDTAARLIWSLAGQGRGGTTVNLGATGTVNIGELHKRLDSKSEFVDGAKHVRFDISTDKLSCLIADPLPQSNDEVESFFKSIGR